MISQSAAHWRTMSLTAGISGLLFLILGLGAQGFIQIGGAEPAFDAPAAAALGFFETRDPELFTVGAYLSVLALVTFLWFLSGLWVVLREAEGGTAWRSMVAFASGLVFVAFVTNGGWQLAAFRAAEGLDAQLARFAFDMGNLGFASSWVALASLLIASGWIMVASRSLPNWLGWWAIVAGAGFLAARAVWTMPFWFFPYALFWLWVIAVSILLIRGRFEPAPTS